MHRYTEQEIIDKVEKEIEKGIETLYRKDTVNYKGKTKDTEKYYSEVIAEYLLNNKPEELKNIQQINRKYPYKQKSHTGNCNVESGRIEENLAKNITKKKYPVLGKIFDYQIPLKKTSDDKAGKIDLASVNNSEIYLIELKTLNKRDTLLRTILEIQTFYCQLDKEKFLSEYKDDIKVEVKKENIKKAILIEPSCLAWDEFEEINERNNLKKLIQSLQIEIFTYEFTINNIKTATIK